MKYRLTALIFVVILGVFSAFGFAHAASLSLTRIGLLETQGKTYPEWWYTGKNPTLYGTASASKDVKIKVNDKSYDTTADTEGNWESRIDAESGDLKIEITSGEDTIKFTLHLGQGLPSSTTATTETSSSTTPVPATGSQQTSALTLGLGISLLAIYFYFSDTNKKHKVFERNIISDK